MKEKTPILIYISLILSLLIFHPITIFAQSNHVKDCLENEEDCTELEGTYLDEVDSEDQLEALGKNERSLPWLLFRMGIALLLVIALIYLSLRFLNKRQNLFQPMQALENLGGISVGQNKTIQVIRVGTKVYLIGVGDDVKLLKEIEDEDVIETLMEKEQDQSFTANKILSTLFPKKNETEPTKTDHGFQKTLSAELEQLRRSRKELINDEVQREDRS